MCEMDFDINSRNIFLNAENEKKNMSKIVQLMDRLRLNVYVAILIIRTDSPQFYRIKSQIICIIIVGLIH